MLTCTYDIIANYTVLASTDADDASLQAPRTSRPIPGTRKSVRVRGNPAHTSSVNSSCEELGKGEETDLEDSESDGEQPEKATSRQEMNHSDVECDLSAAAE